MHSRQRISATRKQRSLPRTGSPRKPDPIEISAPLSSRAKIAQHSQLKDLAFCSAASPQRPHSSIPLSCHCEEPSDVATCCPCFRKRSPSSLSEEREAFAAEGSRVLPRGQPATLSLLRPSLLSLRGAQRRGNLLSLLPQAKIVIPREERAAFAVEGSCVLPRGQPATLSLPHPSLLSLRGAQRRGNLLSQRAKIVILSARTRSVRSRRILRLAPRPARNALPPPSLSLVIARSAATWQPAVPASASEACHP